MARLQDKVAIVTGGAQGLGEGIARRLAEEGASVVIADINGAKAKSVADGLTQEGKQALAVTLDVAERKQVRDAIQKTVDRFGRLDVMFNNAGFNKPLPFMDVDEDNFNSIMRVNAFGVLVGTQEAARQMMAQGGGGKIINTASIAGRQGYAEFAPYCASKASVISLTQAAAREFGKHKITVNAFAPGVVVTPLWDGLEQDMIDKGVIKQKGEFIEFVLVEHSAWLPFQAKRPGRDHGFSSLLGFGLHNRAGHHVGWGHGARVETWVSLAAGAVAAPDACYPINLRNQAARIHLLETKSLIMVMSRSFCSSNTLSLTSANFCRCGISMCLSHSGRLVQFS